VNILQITTTSKDYVFTHGAHACERACASARMGTHSITFGRILFKFDGHILHMTTSYMAYKLIMFNHRVRACVCEGVCERAHY
jgi:hypothetical protein